MNRLNDNELYLCSLLEIEVALLNINDLNSISKYPLKVQVEINSGMNRFGIKQGDIYKTYNLNIVGIYSHNATIKDKYIRKQLMTFYKALSIKDVIDIHYQSSSLIDWKIPYVNCKRIGEYLYKDSLSLIGNVVGLSNYKKGSFIGYNYSYKLKKDSIVAVVDIGYSDGFVRKCNGYKVFINNKFYPLIGLACMNHCFVLVDENVKEKDFVEFFGSNNELYNYIKFSKKISHQVYLEISKGLNK